MLAEDMLLATGCMTPAEQGSVYREAKSCYLTLQVPETNSPLVADHDACRNRPRRIAALADEDLTMDPRPVRLDHDN